MICGRYEIISDFVAQKSGLEAVTFINTDGRTPPLIELWFRPGTLPLSRAQEVAEHVGKRIPAHDANFMTDGVSQGLRFTPANDYMTPVTARNTFMGLLAANCIEARTLVDASAMFDFSVPKEIAEAARPEMRWRKRDKPYNT